MFELLAIRSWGTANWLPSFRYYSAHAGVNRRWIRVAWLKWVLWVHGGQV